MKTSGQAASGNGVFAVSIPEAIRSLLQTNTLPELGPGPRPGVKSQPELRSPLDAALVELKLSADKKDLIRALVFLWHDHLEPAHLLAQSIDNPDGAFVHGIMHRREPDYGNAAYWFRHVGEHQAFPEIGRRTEGLLESRKELRNRLISNGKWNPFGFIDSCRDVAGRSNPSVEVELLQQLQRHETEALIEYLSKS